MGSEIYFGEADTQRLERLMGSLERLTNALEKRAKEEELPPTEAYEAIRQAKVKEKLSQLIFRYTEHPDVKINSPGAVLEYLIMDLKELRDSL